MDKETVITHLQIIHTWAEFARECDLQFFTAKHLKDIAQWTDDAIALLKEQEADKKDVEYMPTVVVPVTIGNDHRTWLCSVCGAKLQYKKEFICPKCYRKIDWEGR